MSNQFGDTRIDDDLSAYSTGRGARLLAIPPIRNMLSQRAQKALDDVKIA